MTDSFRQCQAPNLPKSERPEARLSREGRENMGGNGAHVQSANGGTPAGTAVGTWAGYVDRCRVARSPVAHWSFGQARSRPRTRCADPIWRIHGSPRRDHFRDSQGAWVGPRKGGRVEGDGRVNAPRAAGGGSSQGRTDFARGGCGS